MFLNITPLNSIHRLLILAGLLLTFTATADNKLALPISEEKQVKSDNDEIGLEKTLEQNFSPEDRARLRKALSDYARNTDPEHNQIEQKRRAMKESIAQRFSECDKDNDDTLDREEATLCLPQIARHFNYVDVDEDNLITLEELELAQAKSVERQKAAEAKMEAQRLQQIEEEIKNKSKPTVNINKQASSLRKRPI
ncbi:MAG TPA: hypothetical protein DCO68_00820, partial [Methylophilaceae bacterium]|nr:hypothetical protein [Methylophilaceae bacterium]